MSTTPRFWHWIIAGFWLAVGWRWENMMSDATGLLIEWMLK